MHYLDTVLYKGMAYALTSRCFNIEVAGSACNKNNVYILVVAVVAGTVLATNVTLRWVAAIAEWTTSHMA